MPARVRWWMESRLPTVVVTMIAASLAMAWSCSGDNEAPDGDGGPVCDATTPLKIEALKPRPEAGWYEATAKGGGKTFTLRIELNDDATARLSAGKFSLGAGRDGDYATCQRCVLLLEGSGEPGEASRVFFSAAGTMTLDAVSSPVGSASRGKLEGVVLREVTLDKETSATKAKRGAKCYSLSAASWDNEPKAGGACSTPTDCGDPQVAACGPEGKCVVRQCDFEGEKPCPEGAICLGQTIEASYGACYRMCTPTASDCPAGLECVPLDAEATEGKCIPPGPAQQDQDCDESPASTGCAPGLLCVRDGDGGSDTTPGNPVCRRRCDFFGVVSCGAGLRCAYGGYCTPMTYDQAPVDALCDQASSIGTPCGPDDAAYRGLCVPSPELNDRVACRRACPVDGPPICPEDQYCGGVEGEGISASVCRPFVADEVQP